VSLFTIVCIFGVSFNCLVADWLVKQPAFSRARSSGPIAVPAALIVSVVTPWMLTLIFVAGALSALVQVVLGGAE